MAVYTEKKTYHTKAHMGMIDVTEDFQHAVEEACRQHGISAGTVTGFTTGGVAGLTTLEFEPGIVNHDLKAALDVFSPYQGGAAVPLHHGAFCERQNHCRALAEPDPHRVRHPGPGAGHCVPSDGRVSAAWVPSVRHSSVPAEPGPWRGRALPARTSEMQGPRPRQAAGGCDTRDRMRDIVFQVMGEQAARRLQKRSQHDQRNAPRNGGVFFAYCCRKAQKIDCNLCRVVVSFFYCPLKGCHRKALNRERGEPWKSGTACPRPSAW